MHRPLIVLWLAALSLIPIRVQAEALPHWTARVWHVQDGLTDQVIQAVVQGPDRLLWIGTPRGLLFFDGHIFSSYAGKGSGVLASGVTCLARTSDGSVYAGTDGAGLVRFHGSQVDLLGADQGIGDPLIRVVTEDAQHRIWVGTDHGLFVGGNGVFKTAMPLAQYNNLGWTSIVQDRTGTIWAAGSNLLRVAGDDIKSYKLPAHNGSVRVKAIAEDTDGNIFVGAVSGLYVKQSEDGFRLVAEVPGPIKMFGRLPSGELFVGTAGFGMYVRRSGHFERIEISALPSQTLLSAAADSEGNAWIGTQSGLVRLSSTNLELIPLPTFTSDFGTVSTGGGSLWFCSNGVYRLQKGRIEPYRFPWLDSAIIRAVFPDSSGAIWIGTAGSGVFRVAPDGTRRQFTQEVGTNYIRGFLESRDGSIWIATDGGVSRWKDGHITNFHKVYGAPHTLVTSMFEDAGGKLWLGTQRGLFQLQDDRFQWPRSDLGLPPGPVWAVDGKKDGTIWVGTNSGLFLLRSGAFQQVPLSGGQAPQAVFHIMESRGAFWISGPTQIVRVAESELLRASALSSAAQPIVSQTYSVTDSFPSAELFTGMQQSGAVDTDGSAWFPSSLGPVHIQPEPEPELAHPIPVSVRALVDGIPADVASPLILRAGAETLQVDYAPVMLSSQAGLRFRQRMLPDGNWTTPSTARTALYSGIKVGAHRYQVQAIDSRQRVVGEAQFDLYQRAHFYQRTWFWAVVSLLFAAITLWIYRIRIQRLQISFQAVAKERSRLAREMHDTLIQGCQAVSALLEAVAVQRADSEETKTWLAFARDQIKATIVEARAAVWDLRSQDADDSLEKTLSNMTAQRPGSSAVRISFRKQGAEPRLAHTVTHEIVMAAREALINALTHSAATEVNLELLCTRRQLAVVISDNGAGFSLHDAGVTQGRFGLLGMKERMARIGGSCSVSTAPAKGTTVTLTYIL